MKTSHRWNPETNKWEEISNRSGMTASTLVITDEMTPSVNHADGNVYTSKKAFNAATRAAGCREISSSEAINGSTKGERKNAFPLEVIRDRVEKTYYELRDGRLPMPEQSDEVRAILRRIEQG